MATLLELLKSQKVKKSLALLSYRTFKLNTVHSTNNKNSISR